MTNLKLMGSLRRCIRDGRRMIRACGLFAAVFCALIWFSGPTVAAEPTVEQVRFFETSIRPLLVENCLKCHGEKKQWGSLRLDSREAVLQGGDSGAAVIESKPDESRLIAAVKQLDDGLKMPPDKKLSDRQIADLVRWVEMGLPYPATADRKNERTRDPNHWAFQPPAEVTLPKVKNERWPQTGIDHFILARLEAAGLKPATQADKISLIRRVTFDLIGLPPSPAEIDAFLIDERPEAYSELVDRLLALPAYGERWGRHWLDVARYADSNGLDENVAHGNAWRYRDYVVAAFNDDKPFDRFLVEQIAGDLLPYADERQRHQQLIATGFLAIGPKVLAEVDETKMQLDIVDEQIETVGRAFLGLTLGCARCHDHKFDPIATADYYGLAGIFKSTRTMENFKKVARWHENILNSPAVVEQKGQYESAIAGKKQAIADLVAQGSEEVRRSTPSETKLPENLEPMFSEAVKADLKKLRDELAALEKNPPDYPSAMGATEDSVADIAIRIRGNPLKLGDVVPRHAPAVLRGPAAPQFSSRESGRRELAQWMIDPQHPLTGRVIVNRVWRWHFGKGLVRSVDNFGLLGDAPSHPELLDWLTRRFVAGRWSMKWLHRTIVLSNTYRQGNRPGASALAHDPENRLYSRIDRRRLEAEEVRDSLLAVSGVLDRTLGGTVLTVKNRGYLFDHTSKDLTDYTSDRRSLYLPVIRNNIYDLFQLLDYPDAAIPSGDRSTTTVAPQALLMLNSDFVMSCAAKLADRLNRTEGDDRKQIALLYQLAYGRRTEDAELNANLKFLAQLDRELVGTQADEAARRRQAWSILCHTIIASNEFIHVP